ncbi:threonine synthase [Propylenella binzhouense]|uniref:Threonine synthase n=1 Tax=Propylenella binzhouense TaxID=2555902 RepID=A0A964WTZ6_9HYPH|nr:threonine synthase [Propylenella binzhouense]MYZ48562.1 threonine synthase [Propylenella binzhouense]
MRYVSTRGEAPALGFRDVVLTGLARDGGLYVPETWPRLAPDEIAALAGLPYAEVAARIIGRFTGDELAPGTLRAILDDAYGTFRHPAVTPLVQIAPNHFVLELFHGPTLAFKDVAMQVLARLMDHFLAERGRRATIVGATSGDTGGAAIEAFRGRERIDIAILFPDGRVSPVQRRQMTTVVEDNVQAIAIRGTFDDAQALVKAMFNDFAFRDRVGLAAVNSINWGRIVAQAVYYFYAAVALGAPYRPVSFTVPTGNFGNVFAGYVAHRMGLPIGKLVVATNVNDILDRTIRTGRYEVRGVTPSSSPSMDIQVSSNFERLLFEAEAREASGVRRLMSGLSQSGAFTMAENARQAIRPLFVSGSCGEDETAATIRRTLRETGMLVDPHTAVGIAVAEHNMDAQTPMVTLSTAHPAKFPEAVEAAAGVHPDLPEWARPILTRRERYDVLPNELSEIERRVERHSRAARITA